MSVAVGLSIDYAMHYGAAYRISSSSTSTLNADQRAIAAARDVGGAVAMAAVTTFIVGACLLPSTVLAYRQLGLFLIIVVTVSFLYATFFFQVTLS